MPFMVIKWPERLCRVGVQDGAARLQVFCEWGFKGQAIQPLIDGCRESNFSREWSTGDTVDWPLLAQCLTGASGLGDATGER